MAGLGRRTFQAGEVLTASNVMAYLQDQAVMNFAGTAARGSAIGTAVSEGMVSYLADNNFVQAYDGTAWRSLSGVQVASGTATRDALLPSPVQGDKVFRNDLGYEQTFYGAWGTANPGGRASAGWYDNQRNMGLVPVVPSTVNYSGGTATANTLGTITVTAASSVSFNNVFTSAYTNYKIVFTSSSSAHGLNAFMRMRKTGTDTSGTIYYFGGSSGSVSGTVGGWSGSAANVLQFGNTSIENFSGDIEVYRPVLAERTGFNYRCFGFGATYIGVQGQGLIYDTVSYDGFTIYLSSGNFTGTIQVFGYNS